MDLDLDGKTALVTGASSGIGRAIAIAFGRERANVALTYNSNQEGAEQTAEAVRAAGGRTLVMPYALEDVSSASQCVEGAASHFGGLHVLVHNAVRWPQGFRSVETLDIEHWRATVHANVDGAFALVKAAIPAFRAAGFGRLVTVSTGLVEDGLPGAAPYASAKAALHGLHRTLAKEVGPEGILVNVLMAGTVDSDVRPRPKWLRRRLMDAAATRRMTDVNDVARTAVFLGSPANGHIHGEAIRVDGFFVSPVRLDDEAG